MEPPMEYEMAAEADAMVREAEARRAEAEARRAALERQAREARQATAAAAAAAGGDPLGGATAALKSHFGYSSFRPFQEGVIRAVLEGRDAFVLQSTGSGKSLCYQVPALVPLPDGRPRVVLVVSPLVSLMKDQVRALEEVGVPAVALMAGHSDEDWQRCLDGRYSLIYITPEKALSWGVRNLPAMQRAAGVALLAVDEAHCVSEWGHDFRPEYRKLAELRDVLPGVPVIALTATATRRVRGDIASNLRLRNPVNAVGKFCRPNLTYTVRRKTSIERDMAAVFPSAAAAGGGGGGAECALVYCQTRKDTERLAAVLSKRGLRADAYHAGLQMHARNEAQRRFMMDELQVLVATTAFGMGIDKRDIRLLVHYGVAGSIESYYQQTGRAGRDGEDSRCVMFYNEGDFFTQNFLAERTAREMAAKGGAAAASASASNGNALLDGVRRYVSSPLCRRQALLEYFEETCEPCGACDRCGVDTAKCERDITAAALLFLDGIGSAGYTYGVTKYVGLLRGAGKAFAEKPTYGLARAFYPQLPVPFYKSFIGALASHGYLAKPANTTYAVLGLTAKARQLLADGSAWLRWARAVPRKKAPDARLGNALAGTAPAPAPAGMPPLPRAVRVVLMPDVLDTLKAAAAADSRRRGGDSAATASWSDAEHRLYEELVSLRARRAQEASVPAYHVYPNRAAQALVASRPTTREALAQVEGFGSYKIKQYGDDILRVVAAAAARDGLATNVPPAAAPASQATSSQASASASVSASAPAGSQGGVPSTWTAAQRSVHAAVARAVAEESARHGVPESAVLPAASLVPFAAARPTTDTFFLSVYGCTQERLERHGAALMKAAGDAAAAAGLPVNQSPFAQASAAAASTAAAGALDAAEVAEAVAALERAGVPQRQVDAAEAFFRGETVQDIASSMGVAARTVSGYVSKALEAVEPGAKDHPLPAVWPLFRITEAAFAQVSEAAEGAGYFAPGSDRRLRPVKELLPEHIDYETIKLCLLRHRAGYPVGTPPPKRRRDDEPSLAAMGAAPLRPVIPASASPASVEANLERLAATPERAPKRVRAAAGPAPAPADVLGALRKAGGLDTATLASLFPGHAAAVRRALDTLAGDFSIYEQGGRWMPL